MLEKAELLLPAGSLVKLKTSILYGADAVYAGTPDMSLRTQSKISMEDLQEGIKFVHDHGKKIYLTLNLFMHNRDVEKLPHFLDTLRQLKPDGVLIADPGVFQYVKDNAPELNRFVSTQANICSWQAVKFWQSQGAKLCVLGREVTFEEMKEIRQKCPDILLECFMHGAMCMSYSGRCLLSNFITGRPANRGACAQLCRWKYDVILRECETGIEMPISEDNRGAYIMNSKDLCLMTRLGEVIAAGPDSLKIEGRNRSEYYVGSVVHAYRVAMDAYARDPENFDPAPYMEMLNVLESRGYTTAFFDGPLPPDAHNYDSARSMSDYHAAGVITGMGDDGFVMELRNEIHPDDEIIFVLPNAMNSTPLRLPQIISATTRTVQPKMSAGQKNSIFIPREWIAPEIADKLVPLVLAYKRK